MHGSLGSRIVIAGTHSGVGKTTIATGIMAALVKRGRSVASAKVGPDFIDPGYHSLATGRPGRNLDDWICGTEAMSPLAEQAARGTEILVIEGVMGLFDGVSDLASLRLPGTTEPEDHEVAPGVTRASTASVAITTKSPVVLVVDAAAMSSSAGAIVHGYNTFVPQLRLSGVILNRVASEAHLRGLKEAIEPTGVPVVGVLRKDDVWHWRDRHLGLVPVVEHPDTIRRTLDHLGTEISSSVDLEAIDRIARSAPRITLAPIEPARHQGRARIAVAGGKAFSFVYPDNLERLEQAGAEIIPFDPLLDRALPDGTQAIVAGGGFPETFAEALAENRQLLENTRRSIEGGTSVWAECGGLLWLASSLDGHRLCQVIDAKGSMSKTLTLGYRSVRASRDNPVSADGEILRGHEFHYSKLDPPGDALEMAGRQGPVSAGWCGPNLFASYLHVHLGSDPRPAERFVAHVCGRDR